MFAFLGVTLILAGCNNEPPLAEVPPLEVVISRPVQEKVVDWDHYTGTVEAKETVEVRARVRGEIKEVCFKEGDEIPEGALLFVLDSDPFKADLKQAQGKLTAWKGKLEYAEEKIKLYKPLAEKGTVSKEELLQAMSLKAEAIGGIDTSNGSINQAELNIGYCQITSKIAGRVGQALLTKGNIVNANPTESLLTTVVSVEPVYVYFSVNERAMLTYQKVLRDSAAKAAKNGKDSKEAKDLKDGKDLKNGKDSQEAKDLKDGKDSKQAKDLKDASDLKDGKDSKQAKDSKDASDLKDGKDSKQAKDSKEAKGPKDGKDSKQAKDSKEAKGPKDGKDSKEAKDSKQAQESKIGKDAKEVTDAKQVKDAKVANVPKELQIPVELALTSDVGYPFKGVIDFIDNRIDPSTGSIKVRARFDNPKGSDGRRMLTPGLFARVRVAIADPYPATLVADRAILTDQSLKYVLVVNKDKKNTVERVDITASNRLQPGCLRAVDAGLKGGEWIIVDGVNRARPGVIVNPKDELMPRCPLGTK
jgi:multidrug efflux pump subunit AcrA (membrane-fusion protein)